jgi:phage terminase small subunit
MPRSTTALTPKQQRFVDEYLVDLNATRAAIRAGYSKRTAASIGEENLRKPEVSSAIDARKAKRAEKVEVKAEAVLRELQTFGHMDPAEIVDDNGRLLPLKQMPEHVRRAIASVEIEEIWDGKGDDRVQVGELKKVKFWNKKDGLELLGKHIKLFGDEGNASITNVFQVNATQLTVQLDYTRLTVEEHRTLVALMEKATPPEK